METLPNELLRDIVSYVDDCISLYNLLRASPAISRLFNHDGLQLTRAVFFKDNMCGNQSTSWPYNPAPTDPSLSKGLPDSTAIRTIRRVLSRHLEGFNALRPESIVDPEAGIQGTVIGPFKVPVQDYGPPVWEEEQRVSRAFWRIQLFYDLRTADGRFELGWSDDDMWRLQSTKERDLYVKWHLRYEPEEIQTVTEYLDQAQAADLVVSRDDCGGGGPNRDPRRLLFLLYQVKRSWPTRQKPDPQPEIDRYKIGSATFGLRQCGLLAELPFSPLRTVKFDSYRQLGPGERYQRNAINLTLCQFAWRSILDPREVEEVENRSQTE
ncbi:hypothetical protein BDW71DRAFT_197987 [Aspergillus fruticulosus]